MATMTWLMVVKEILAAMNKGENTQDEEERMRRMMRDVVRETNNASSSEREMSHRLMQLLEQNVTRHSAELKATTQERDHYKTKMEELNHRMEQLMRDGGGHPSGGEDQGLTNKQKRLAEMWEELKEMRQNKRSDQTTQGKPFNKGGQRGGGEASGARKPQYKPPHERASFQSDRQNKDGSPFSPGEYPSQGRDSEKLGTGPHKDYKSGGFRSKPFQQDNRYQEGPMSSPEMFTQYGGRDGRRDFVPFSGNTDDNSGRQPDNRHWQGDSGPGFNKRDGVQNVGMQNRGPNKGSYQHRGRSSDRGQHQQQRGQCNPHRGQFHQHRGQFHQHRGQFHQHRGQSQDGRQGQRSFDSGSRNPPNDFSFSQFSPEEVEAIKTVLKQREAEAAESARKSGSLNPSKTTGKKTKEQKEPKGAAAMLPDDSESDDDDDDDAFMPSKGFAVATDDKPMAESKKKKKKNRNKGSKDQGAAEQKPEGLSPLEVFTASGFDTSQIAGLNMNHPVHDLMLITKEDGNIVSCQPKTVRELVEFKQQYPNAQVIIVKTSDQK